MLIILKTDVKRLYLNLYNKILESIQIVDPDNFLIFISENAPGAFFLMNPFRFLIPIVYK
jgi:hypothetical protein